MLKKILIVTCACFALSLQAQVNINKIKSDSNYIWAEGEGITFDEADNDALRRLSSQIWTAIYHGSIDSAVIKKNGNNSVEEIEKQQVFTQAFTANTIPNARFIELSPEPDSKVFRYVHNDDIVKMIQAKTERIVNLVNTGKRAEQSLQIDDALRNYYWALMLAKTHTESVYVELGGEKVDCLSELPRKIKSVLAGIKAELVSCEKEADTYIANTRFTYNDHDISSLQLKYHNGVGYIGPLTIRDGIGQFDLQSLPDDENLLMTYEYRFQKEAVNFDVELEMAFKGIKSIVSFEARGRIPVKINKKKGTVQQDKKETAKMELAQSAEAQMVKPEKTREVNSVVTLEEINENEPYLAVMRKVENAIKSRSPRLAKDCFADGAYGMFDTLMTKTGTITLVGEQKYEFVKVDESLVLARPCNIKVKYSNGKSFMEKLVFRFNPINHKIQSLAYCLTDKAEKFIFNDSAPWGNADQRYTIMQFMEDYQTAFALKRMGHIDKIFSEDAIIIIGTEYKTVKNTKTFSDIAIKLGNPEKVAYKIYTKKEYLKNLKKHFRANEYSHLTFEDNMIKKVNTNGLVADGAAYAIQIRQYFNSPRYSDVGYLTLFLDMQGQYPMILVRLWQPDKSFTAFDDFCKEFIIELGDSNKQIINN